MNYKRLISIFMSIIACMVLSSCGRDSAVAKLEANHEGDDLLYAGIWSASVDGEIKEYYFVESNGKSGHSTSVEDCTEVLFEFEFDKEEKTAVFQFDNQDKEEKADYSKKVKDGKISIILNWIDKEESLVLTYVDDVNTEFDGFYSDKELEIMARNCYADKHRGTKYVPKNIDIHSVEGTAVIIQLYDEMEDHTATAAWYEIDRFTGEGKDTMTDESIDFNQYCVYN